MTELVKLMQAQFDKMCATGKLFRSSVTGQQVWDLYMKGFGNDPIFRDPESSVHNCNLCNNFIRRYGNVVAIDDDFKIVTMFDVASPEEYTNSLLVISAALRKAPVSEIFFETFNELNSLPYESCNKSNEKFKLGVDKNVKRYTKEEAEKFGVVQLNEIRTFNHFHLFLPKQFVDMGSKSIDSIMADYRDAKNVFQRAMVEISIDTLNLVRDLINQGSLLDGTTHLHKIEAIISKKLLYDEFSPSERDNWLWINSYKFQFAKFKNELIGVLCSELAEGKELNDACQAWNKRVDPANYMKAVAPITKKQIENGIETDRYRANHFNQSYFKQIDIKDKAYFLGLLYADGNIYLRRNRTQITLKNEDCYILELFNKYIDSSVKLYQDRKYKKLILDSKELSGDLIKLGCIPNKSLVVTFPTEEQVPKELLHHFIRGYFDGNGSATIGKSGMSVSFTANEVFLSSLSKILSGVGIYVSDYKKRYKDHEISAGTIYISRRYDQ